MAKSLAKPSEGELFDVSGGAGYLNLKDKTLRAWILQRRIPYVKLGRRVLFRKRDLDALIENSLVPAQKTK
jgi:excisionase family DNA binding protein